MRKFRFRSILVLVAALSLVAAACGGGDEPTEPEGGATGGATGSGACADADTSAGDLLAKICTDGVITVSTDPAYPPQSSLDVETGDYVGFDIDVATEIANRLGVGIEWSTPKWEAITAGNWQGRWDMSVGSMTVLKERAEVLDFTPAYYFTPASIAVPEDSDITSVDQLSGATVAVCAGCTYDFFLNGTLEIPGYTIPAPPAGVTTKGFDTDSTAIQAVESGQADAVMSATPTLQDAIDKGRPMQLLGDPLYYEPLSAAMDKESDLDQSALVAAVSDIIDEMHADGTLTDMSMEWYGQDLTVTKET